MDKAIILYRYEIEFGLEKVISKWFVDIYKLKLELQEIRKSISNSTLKAEDISVTLLSITVFERQVEERCIKKEKDIIKLSDI